MLDWLLGIGVGFIIHEAAHEAMARANGGQTSWKGTTIIYQGPNEKAFYMAGLASQMIASEILLTRDYQTNFTKGWLAFNVGNAVSYTIKNEITPGGYLDLGKLPKNEARQLETVLLIHSYTVADRVKWKFVPTRNGVMFRKEL